MPDNAIKDKEGRFLCYDFVHGRCTDPCPGGRYHGPETAAMKAKRLKDEKLLAERAAAKKEGNASGGEQTPRATADAASVQPKTAAVAVRTSQQTAPGAKEG